MLCEPTIEIDPVSSAIPRPGVDCVLSYLETASAAMAYEYIRSSVSPDYLPGTGNSADEAFSMNDEVTLKGIDFEIQ
jgi:hypothetical protein